MSAALWEGLDWPRFTIGAVLIAVMGGLLLRAQSSITPAEDEDTGPDRGAETYERTGRDDDGLHEPPAAERLGAQPPGSWPPTPEWCPGATAAGAAPPGEVQEPGRGSTPLAQQNSDSD
ncbi:hypothetical protein ACIP93_33915 [Streptomyces sp. NPDC088745]|uniref:hypothetical protein n=1 Tax=Streptomyces sp. NPDC088745 TaxID=3365884 RepID=UPI00382CE36B